MPAPTYSTGLVSVENGSDVVNVAGGAWVEPVVFAGDLIQFQSTGEVYFIKELNSASQAVLTQEFAGTTIEDGEYLILRVSPRRLMSADVALRVTELLDKLNLNTTGWLVGSGAPDDVTDGEDGYIYVDSVTGDLYGPKVDGEWPASIISILGPQGNQGVQGVSQFRFIYDDGTTTTSDPGAGKFRFNAEVSSATAACFDDLDSYGANVETAVQTWDNFGVPAGRALIVFRKVDAPTTYAYFLLTGSITNGVGFSQLVLTYISGAGTFIDDDVFDVMVVPCGIQGPQGDQGEQGDKGWSPSYVIETDGARRVLKLIGYVGGEGDEPTDNVGEYVGASGYEEDISNGVDIRGQQGTQGIQGIQGIQGDQGDQGYTGWSPVFSIASDGERRVLKLIGYVGGEGDEPTDNVDEYVAVGGFDADISNGVDIRGQQGPQGDEGIPGADGAVWYYGTVDPDNGNGANGDFYLQTDDGSTGVLGDVWKKTADEWAVVGNILGPQGDEGPQGDQGQRGATWTSGATDPTGGEDDDLYLQTDDGSIGVVGDVWKKTAGEWSVIANIRGATGATGADGDGDVNGPESSSTGNVVVFADETGKEIEDSGMEIADLLDADNHTDGSTNKLFTATEKTKLAGVEENATANDTDANLLDRANHTGSQAISTITGLESALDDKADLDSPALTGTPTAPTASAADNSTKVATTAYVDAAVNAIIAAADAMVFSGTIDASTNPNYPAADKGHTYKISSAGKIGGASGPNVEINDLIICTADSTASGDDATVGAYWAIIQANVDGAVIGPSSVTDGNPVLFDGTTGKLIKQTTWASFKASLALAIVDISGLQAALDAKAPVSNPTFTGDVTAPSNLIVGANIQHAGDTNTEISFTPDAIDVRTNNNSRLDLDNSGVRLGGANARVTTILDEDGMDTNSATALATQQSIKSYVDAGLAGKANSSHSHSAGDLPDASLTEKGIVELATAGEYRTGTDTTRALVTDRVWYAAQLVELTQASTISIDFSDGFNFGGAGNAALGLTGNRALGAPSNVNKNQSGIVWFYASGNNRTLTLNAAWTPASNVETGPYLIPNGDFLGVAYDVVGTTVIVTNIIRIET